jgi:hypothetical protein
MCIERKQKKRTSVGLLSSSMGAHKEKKKKQ